MIGYPIVFRCCECTVEEQTIEHLEKHIWSRHLQAFPFRCAQCDFPAINAESLLEHSEVHHGQAATIDFKRNLEDEKRLRKMIAESIAIEIDESSQAVPSEQLTMLQPMSIPQGATQIMLVPSDSTQYETIVDHRGADEDDFGVLEDDENVEEMLEEDDDEAYLDGLGNPVFIGAHDDPDYILEDELPPHRATSYHMKYIRTRRMDKLIDNVVVSAARRSSPDEATEEAESRHLNRDGQKMGKFSCDQCDRTFQYMSKLDEHRRTHLGVKPFSCPYCSRQFTQKGALKTHMRLHTGERPFVCQWECGRDFSSASARTHHEKTHSGERPYICNVCGKGFTKNSHVMRHLKNIHHKDMVARATGTVLDVPPDIAPRGKETEVVHDIVEQIHEEKFAEQANFKV